jgi:hypothetical protein
MKAFAESIGALVAASATELFVVVKAEAHPKVPTFPLLYCTLSSFATYCLLSSR